MKQIKKTTLPLIFMLPLLSAQPIYANSFEEDVNYSLKELSADNIKKIQKAKLENHVDSLRAEAIKSVALQLGTSAGLAAEFKKYEKMIESKSAELDKTYDFEKLKISPGVLPPVISQGFGNYQQKSDKVFHVSGKTFKIEEDAKVVSVFPTWRDYLKLNFKPADLPSNNFMPKTKAEKKLWDSEVKKGWEIGARQAAEVWNNSFAKLQRDYEGMILYKQLLADKAALPVVVATAKLGVTGNSREMSVDHMVVEITQDAELNPNQNRWRNKNPATFKSVKGEIF